MECTHSLWIAVIFSVLVFLSLAHFVHAWVSIRYIYMCRCVYLWVYFKRLLFDECALYVCCCLHPCVFVYFYIVSLPLCTLLFSKLFISFRACIRFKCRVQQIFIAELIIFSYAQFLVPFDFIGCLFVCLLFFSSGVYHVTAWYLLCANRTRFKRIQCRGPSQTLYEIILKSTKIDESHPNAHTDTRTHAQFVYSTAF